MHINVCVRHKKLVLDLLHKVAIVQELVNFAREGYADAIRVISFSAACARQNAMIC